MTSIAGCTQSELFFIFFISADESTSVAGGKAKFQTDVVVLEDGKCMWRSPAIFTSDCQIEVKYWPFGTQKCDLEFASFTMPKKRLDLNVDTYTGSLKAGTIYTPVSRSSTPLYNLTKNAFTVQA